ncbi:hypothetical protein NLG97_g11308 [Lecanicillium saksenae]|uniref:Uncharacterized protein n=1 Tax=Lecanicillium saksenae TaxID=468837 RepID=A0ACC1QCK0_9HYPO|nr:hypothetical protein NLG97_g11308 [Lecanicillium saksenae]
MGLSHGAPIKIHQTNPPNDGILDELVLGANLAYGARGGAVGGSLGHDGPDLVRRLAAQQGHFALEQNGHGGADEQRIALKDVHVP